MNANVKKILSPLIAVVGEAIVVAAFLVFGAESEVDVLVLNIAVSSVVYWAVVLTWRAPWMDLGDKSQRRAGALGVGWFATGLYSLLAVATMIVANVAATLAFPIQLIVHCILLFPYLLGATAARRSSDKAAEVYERESARRNGIDDMKSALRDLKNKVADADGLPDALVQRIVALDEDLRFASPSDNGEAHALERSFVETVAEMVTALSNRSTVERIENGIRRCERLCRERKNVRYN